MEKTLAKGLMVLEALTVFPEPTGVSELAATLGISRSNAHRLLRTLVETGFADSADGQYWPTLKVWELGSQVIRRYEVQDFARPAIIRVAAQCDEEVRLAIFDPMALEAVYLDKIDSSQDVRAFSEVASRSPSHCTSSGKALLMYQSDEVIWRAAQQLAPRTPWTLTDPEAFVADLMQARRDGYALSIKEFSENVSGVGAPIIGPGGQVIAAISVIGPADRLTEARLREIGELAQRACESVSARMAPHKPNAVHLKDGLKRLLSE